MKKCSVCKIYKQLTEFGKDKPRKDGLSYVCKCCKRAISKKWRDQNPEKASNTTNNYRIRNKKHISDYKRKRRQTNIQFGLAHNIRSRLKKGLTSAVLNKSEKYKDYIGCSYSELKSYIERQFTNEMTWENHGSYWHIDHIIPLGFCNKGDSDFMKTLTHYTNLRPLKKEDNLKKNDKIDLTLASAYGIVIPEAYIKKAKGNL